tara:strand:+ start:9 stop:815 length:807 start_codon:yes stop_codon:yes gene_type:complete
MNKKGQTICDKVTSMPKIWWKDNPVMTYFFNSLSVLLPVGEAFFIRSVKYYEKKVSQVSLLEDVRLFLNQEAQHHKEHGAWNDMIKAQGHNVEAVGRSFNLFIKYGQKYLTPIQLLAFTVASEHVTAVLARVVLSNPKWLDGASQEYRRIWLWHAFEELEHKAVAFDLYQHVGGSYFLRVFAFLQTSLVFPLFIFEMMMKFSLKDKVLFKLRTWRQVFDFGLLVGKDFFKIMFYIGEFLLPSFHPKNHNDEGLIHIYAPLLKKFCRPS